MIGSSEKFIFRDEDLFIEANSVLYYLDLAIYKSIMNNKILSENFKDIIDLDMLKYLEEGSQIRRYYDRQEKDFFKWVSNGKISTKDVYDIIFDLNDLTQESLLPNIIISDLLDGITASIKKSYVKSIDILASTEYDAVILKTIFSDTSKFNILTEFPDSYDKYTMIIFAYADKVNEVILDKGIMHFKDKTICIPRTSYNHVKDMTTGEIAMKYDLDKPEHIGVIDIVDIIPYRLTQDTVAVG
ncbi:MAG: hypothetical protein ACRCXT_06220 [Paraclostridium sp.]